VLEVDLRRNVSADIVILINRGTFRGHDGVRELARILGKELPEHHPFEYPYRVVEGRMAFLEQGYEDADVRVRGGADSYLIEEGNCVLFYSDGLVEAHDPKGEMFGFPRLRALVAEHGEERSLGNFLLEELYTFVEEGWEQEDDITLLTLRRSAAPS
jgi:Stage II sporulation protein E (SpoIIE)